MEPGTPRHHGRAAMNDFSRSFVPLSPSRPNASPPSRKSTSLNNDRPPIGDAVHRILAWEEQAILELIETWGPGPPVTPQARAPRLLHRPWCSSRLRRCCASRSSIASSCSASGFAHDCQSRRFPRFPGKRTGSGWDATHFTRCKRVAYAIVDVDVDVDVDSTLAGAPH